MKIYPGHGHSGVKLSQVKQYNQFAQAMLSWSDNQIDSWVINNDNKLKDWNEYAFVTFGMSLDQLKDKFNKE